MFGLLFVFADVNYTPFIDYPGFVHAEAIMEAHIDRGPIVELIIKCGQGSASISFSKVERLFCSPKFSCDASFDAVVAKTCS
jgi:hypothetical protein